MFGQQAQPQAPPPPTSFEPYPSIDGFFHDNGDQVLAVIN
jgi:hypothetical protein